MVNIKVREGKSLQEGQRVYVYRNLHDDCFSILDPKTNLVVAYAKTVALRNVEFRVRKGGQQKVRESGRKNVHAFVVGEISSKQSIEGNGTVVSYNPYRNDTFVEKETQSPIHSCLYAIMEGTGLLAYN